MIHNIPQETILEQTSTSIKLSVNISANSDYFDGHFPQFKLLPAVAQIDLVVHYANKYFNIPLSTPKIKRFKFSDKIFPDTTVIFTITHDPQKNKITFTTTDSTTTTTYSSGTYEQ